MEDFFASLFIMSRMIQKILNSVKKTPNIVLILRQKLTGNLVFIFSKQFKWITIYVYKVYRTSCDWSKNCSVVSRGYNSFELPKNVFWKDLCLSCAVFFRPKEWTNFNQILGIFQSHLEDVLTFSTSQNLEIASIRPKLKINTNDFD